MASASAMAQPRRTSRRGREHLAAVPTMDGGALAQ
jgi:hypothetical protein